MSDSVTVVFHDKDGSVVPLSLPTGENLMQALRDGGVRVTSICHGRAICGMCRVFVKAAAHPLATLGSNERRLLDALPGPLPEHRLACQILLSVDHEGLAFMLDEPD